MNLDVEFGNAGELDTNGTGWFVGFSEWAKAGPLRYMPKDQSSHTLCMKWMDHPTGDPRGAAKPPSEGRSLSIFVSERGRFRIQFSPNADFSAGQTQEFILARHGDFVAWGERVHHRWLIDEACTILTLRWVPEP